MRSYRSGPRRTATRRPTEGRSPTPPAQGRPDQVGDGRPQVAPSARGQSRPRVPCRPSSVGGEVPPESAERSGRQRSQPAARREPRRPPSATSPGKAQNGHPTPRVGRPGRSWGGAQVRSRRGATVYRLGESGTVRRSRPRSANGSRPRRPTRASVSDTGSRWKVARRAIPASVRPGASSDARAGRPGCSTPSGRTATG